MDYRNQDTTSMKQSLYEMLVLDNLQFPKNRDVEFKSDYSVQLYVKLLWKRVPVESYTLEQIVKELHYRSLFPAIPAKGNAEAIVSALITEFIAKKMGGNSTYESQRYGPNFGISNQTQRLCDQLERTSNTTAIDFIEEASAIKEQFDIANAMINRKQRPTEVKIDIDTKRNPSIIGVSLDE
jgi:hypothetical protein